MLIYKDQRNGWWTKKIYNWERQLVVSITKKKLKIWRSESCRLDRKRQYGDNHFMSSEENLLEKLQKKSKMHSGTSTSIFSMKHRIQLGLWDNISWVDKQKKEDVYERKILLAIIRRKYRILEIFVRVKL